MKNNQIVLILIVGLMVASCNTNHKLIGLWQIEKVKVGDQEMTPVARWTRLNEDHSQESGNGWYQHSIGNWEYDSERNKMSLINTNSVKDEFGEFTVTNTKKDKMQWSRKEEGEKVEVTLKRIKKLPQAPANKMLGVWKLKTNNKSLADSYLFFRWDHILVAGQKGSKKNYGMYKTHGHKQKLQIIYYEEPLRREDWQYRINENDLLTLTRKDEEKEVILEYERIDFIPE